MLTFWLGVYYLIWVLRVIDQGRAVSGIIVCCLFGGMLIYTVKVPSLLKTHSWMSAFCATYVTGWFGWLWYITLKGINDSMLTGTPTFLARGEFKGFFGIEGFWGIGVFIPMYLVLIIVMWTLMDLWEKGTMHYKYKRKVKRREKDEYEKRRRKIVADNF